MIRKPVFILVLLTALNGLNYLDRLVLSAVLPDIQKELGFNDFFGGLLATVFLVGYFATSPVFGWLADRRSRTALITGGIVVWSIATVASGFARDSYELLASRIFVGVGEASFSAIAPTIIDDIAPSARKNRWLSVYYMAVPIGSALGYVAGGLLDKAFGWRSAFFIAGGPGILLALTCLLIVEPARGEKKATTGLVESVRTLLAQPLYRRAVSGYCFLTFALGAFSYWAPTYLARTYGAATGKGAPIFGVVTVVAGAVGTILGGALADRRAAALRPVLGEDLALVHGGLRICVVAAALGAPFSMMAFFAPTENLFYTFAFCAEVALFLTWSPINAALLKSVPGYLRNSAMAVAIFMIHMFGDLWSSPLVGALSDRFGMRTAVLILPAALVFGAVTWWVPRPAVAADPSGAVR